MAKCLICEGSYEPFISFGKQPIANGFLTPDRIKDEYFFEMIVGYCPSCEMVQLVDQPERERMFNENYAFFSGTSKLMAVHFQKFYEFLRENYMKSPDPFVVEMGSNDGIMLQNFAQAKIRHLGIEPSANVAKVAQEKGINTIVEFFDEAVAQKVVAKYGKADAFYCANVMCHIPYIHSVAAGIKTILGPKGVLAFEDPYLGDIVEKTSYDQVYDEHVFFFSVASVSNLFGRHGLEVIDAIPQETHGGSMRYILAHKGAYPVSDRVAKQREIEKKLGLDKQETYAQLRRNIEKSREELVALLKKIKAEGGRVVGYGATSKSTTILNYCGIGPDLIEFISDTTPIKQGKLSPGVHIPVLPYEKFVEKYPTYALLFAWNHRKEIMAKESAFLAAGGKWITYVPNVHIFDKPD
ncbi:MAG: class I SAM-dependent methyltransferase [Leptospirales bacterium]|nr:class I SAM-dependent methyltransferase [Leptospirales bacterium]